MNASSLNSPLELKASPGVRKSAEKLEQHIRACGLKSGDRYITTEAAGKLLGKSVVIAQRAMNLLAQKNILERRPKAGTFIGSGIGIDTQTINIHFFAPEQSQTESANQASYWEQIDGIRSVLGHLSAHFHFIPNQNLGYVQQIVHKTSEAGLMNGVVLILPTRNIRAYFNESGIPTVVEGGVEADLGNLCWIQWDQVQVGRLLTEYLLDRGHRRLVTVMRDIWSIGEHLLHDGINETLTERSLPSNTLRMRSAPSEEQAIVELIRGLLTEKEPPTGFICRNEFQADCVMKVLHEAGLKDQVDVVHCNAPAKPEQNRYTCAVPELTMLEFGQVIGRMFQDLLKSQAPESRGRQISVHIKTPIAQ